jgi:TolB-like protein/Tfp pilus assembly protein PilF
LPGADGETVNDGKLARRQDGKMQVRRTVLSLALFAILPACHLAALQCPTGAPPPCAGQRTTGISPRSVAVLYLANHSADSADAYLADGLTEEIIARLARISRIEVKSRTAVERFRRTTAPPDSLGRALRVAHLVIGTMQRAGPRLRVTVELVRASTGVTAWAGRFDRSDANLLDIETAIADTIAQEVAGRLLPNERRMLVSRPTLNAEAYDLFVRGNYRLSRRTPDDVRLAIRDFEAAAQLDPGFASAPARIALAYSVALDWGWPSFGVPTSIRAGMAASARALELDSLSADAWTARGYILRFANARTYAGVREAFSRAIALAPRDAEAQLQFGWALAGLGERPDAIATLRRSLMLDPERSITRFTLAWVLLSSGRADAAVAMLDTAIAVDPTVGNLFGLRAWSRLSIGDTAGARADAQVVVDGDVRLSLSALAGIERREGNSIAAAAAADRLYASLPAAPARLTWGASWIALACVQAGQAERALDILERIEPQGLSTWWITNFPGFEPLRNDARFIRFVAELAPPGR